MNFANEHESDQIRVFRVHSRLEVAFGFNQRSSAEICGEKFLAK